MQKNNARDSRFPYALIIIFLVFATGIIAAGYFSYQNYANNFRKEVEKQLAIITGLKVDELVQWRRERLGDGNIFFNNPIFSSLVRRYFENPQDTNPRDEIQAWLARVYDYYQYNRISLFDGQGVRRLTIPANAPPASIDLQQHISEVLRFKKVIIEDFYRNEYDQRIYLTVLVPVIDTQDSNRVLGVLILRIDPQQYLYPLLKRWPTPSQTGETLLVRRDGNSALFLNDLRFRKDTALNLRIPLIMVKTPAVQATLGHVGIFEGVDYRGVPVIADVHPVPDSPWFMVARMDIEEVYAPMKERLWAMVLFICVLIAGTGTGLLLIWRQHRVRFYRERLKAAEELRTSEIRYRRLFESAKDGILILDAETGMVVDVNPFLVEMLGYSQKTFLEKKIWELGFIKDIVASKDNFTELQQKEYIRYEGLPLETASGQRIDVEFVSNVYLVNDKKVIQCNIRDITARNRAEKALAIQASIANILLATADEEMYNELLTFVLDVMQSPFGVFGYIDKDGALIVPTMTRQVWPQCQISDKTIRFPRETWGDSSWPRSIRQKKPNYTNKTSTKTPEGHIVLNRHISLPIMLGGEVIGLFQVANKESDYTDADVQRLQSIADQVAPFLRARLDRERYEKELQETNAELTRFTYTMSHDLKSPLVTVKTFLGYLEQDMQKQDTGRIEKDFAFIRGAADKMGRLLDELLDLTRIGRIMNPVVEAPLQEIVQEALVLVAGRIAQRGVKIEVTQKPLVLCGDRVRLVELFQNLIDNAVKFMGDQMEPKIEIGLETKNGRKHLFVRDNGMGIDPRHKDKLFGLFERLNPEMEGTGMGLALVKRIVEVHGGKIWVESEGLGQGTCFWFTLPGK